VYVHTWVCVFVFQLAFKILLTVVKRNLITYSKLSLWCSLSWSILNIGTGWNWVLNWTICCPV